MTVLAPALRDACPSCGGCYPGDGPRVCCCGSDWGPPLRELIRLLDEVLSDPGPPDPAPTPDLKETNDD